MPIRHLEEYRDPEISRRIIEKIKNFSGKKVRLMEVCGTHTMSIFRSGIRSVLPKTISLLSGPGCPVCVTNQNEIDSFINLAGKKDVIVATFGDLLRVPGTKSTLQKERARGGDIRVIYSTSDALEIAGRNPDKKIVFLGIGFETTSPTIAASILSAKEMNLNNYFVFSAHKLVPPALHALLKSKDIKIDGFILPGHVSIIIGIKAYIPIVEHYNMPCVIAGFEPTDILHAIFLLIRQIEAGESKLENGYQRVVGFKGNEKAQNIIHDVFKVVDVSWRGIGIIPKSGLVIRDDFSSFDAKKAFDLSVPDAPEPKGCACGQILTGIKTPPECPLYYYTCSPSDPVGPCMVSSEGTCSAYYRYHGEP